MSPALKEAVPVGTLAGRVLKDKPLSAPVRRQLASNSRGWRSESFRSASDKLSSASVRLSTEAQRETEYWAQVANLTTRGWAVSKLPRDRKAIGVHFGFAEAAPQFRDQGFALLRQLEDGTVTLDGQFSQRKRKSLGVRVLRNNVKTGVFHFGTSKGGQVEDISQQLTEMRDSLFEEELFYEVCREARVVANQGIHTRAQAVEIEVGNGYQLSLVFGQDLEDATSTSIEDNLIAEFVAVSLRLLLNAAHEQNLVRRSQKPPAMTIKSRPIPEYALIRPILAHLRHRAEADAFWKSCQKLLGPFKQAGLPVTMELEKSNTAVFKALNMEAATSIISGVMLPAKTGFTVNLTGGRALEVGLATLLGPPLFGTRYEASAVDFGFSKMPSSRQETKEAAVSLLRRILILDLVAHVEALTKETPPAPKDDGDTKQWAVSQPHSGELTLYEAGDAVKRVLVAVQPESLSVKVKPRQKSTSSKNVVWSWTSKEGWRAEGAEVTVEASVTFDDAMRRIMKESI